MQYGLNNTNACLLCPYIHTYISAAAAKVYSNVYSNHSMWPNVTLPGYESISDVLIDMTDSMNIVLSPVVDPSHHAEFESFAYQYFRTHSPPYLSSSGITSIGKGIFAINE